LAKRDRGNDNEKAKIKIVKRDYRFWHRFFNGREFQDLMMRYLHLPGIAYLAGKIMVNILSPDPYYKRPDITDFINRRSQIGTSWCA